MWRVWRATGGSVYRTWPFRRDGEASEFRLQLEGTSAEVQLQALPERTPFTSCHQLAANRELCTEMHARFARQ